MSTSWSYQYYPSLQAPHDLFKFCILCLRLLLIAHHILPLFFQSFVQCLHEPQRHVVFLSSFTILYVPHVQLGSSLVQSHPMSFLLSYCFLLRRSWTSFSCRSSVYCHPKAYISCELRGLYCFYVHFYPFSLLSLPPAFSAPTCSSFLSFPTGAGPQTGRADLTGTIS